MEKLGRKITINNRISPIFFVKILHASGAVIALYANIIMKSSVTKSSFLVGSYAALLSLLYAVTMIIGGRLADKFSLKKLLVCIELISACCIVMYILVDKKIYLPWCFAVVSGLYNLSSPIITLTAIRKRKYNDSNGTFSILLIALNIGVAIWSYVISNLASICDMLWIILAINLVIAFLAGFVLDEVENEGHGIVESDEKNKSSDVIKWMFTKGRKVLVFMILMITFSINLSHLNVSIPLFMDGLFGDKGDTYFSYIVIENAMVLICCTWGIHKLEVHLKKVSRLILAALFYMLGLGMLLFFTTLPMISVAIFLFSCGEIMSNTTGNTLVLEQTPKKYIATYNSIYNVLSGSGTVIGPLVSTLLIEYKGINAVWMVSVIISICTIMILRFWLYKIERVNEGISV